MPVVFAVGAEPPQVKQPSSNNSRHDDTGKSAKKSRRQRKERGRGQRVRGKRVVPIGEESCERALKKGKVRHLDMLEKEERSDSMPRKTKEFMASMAQWNLQGARSKSKEDNKKPELGADQTIKESGQQRNSAMKRNSGADETTPPANSEGLQHSSKTLESRKRFDGMKSGESLSEYSARLRKESQRIAIDIARKGNHQREKRLAYNKKRRERVAKRKRRRNGESGESDVEDSGARRDEDTQSISHLPAYWQEIVNNNGRPISTKKKRRMMRMEKDATKAVAFGDQVDRPPDFSVLPVRRSSHSVPESL